MNVPLRVIVVEDDYLLSETLVESLAEIGYEVVAQATTTVQGMRSIDAVACDFAIIDFYLKGETALPLLDKLHDLGIPFLVASGAYEEDLPERHARAPRLSKPYDIRELQRAIGGLPSRTASRNPD